MAVIHAACFKPVSLNYSDYIADQCQHALDDRSGHGGRVIETVSRVKSDLHPTGGYLMSCAKTLFVTDRNGRKYKITVAECE